MDKNLKSLRTRSIIDAENHIKCNYNNSFIIRPSIIVGGGDQFLHNLLPFFKNLLFIPLFGKGSKKFQPVHIEDICTLVLNCINENVTSEPKIFEIGGPNIFTYKEFYYLISHVLGKKRYLVPIPMR